MCVSILFIKYINSLQYGASELIGDIISQTLSIITAYGDSYQGLDFSIDYHTTLKHILKISYLKTKFLVTNIICIYRLS